MWESNGCLLFGQDIKEGEGIIGIGSNITKGIK